MSEGKFLVSWQVQEGDNYIQVHEDIRQIPDDFFDIVDANGSREI